MMRSVLTAWVLLANATVPAATAGTPAQELQSVAAAAGGARWKGVVAVVADGREHEDGLDCRLHAVTDLRDGRRRETVRCPGRVTASGIDARGAWRQDRSGGVHELDSPEARTLAVSDRWLNRNGPYRPGRVPARLAWMPATTAGGTRYRRVAATPAGGRRVVLWIAGTPARLARTVMRRSFQTVTTTYGDYRDVDGVMLPFRIVSSLGPHARPDVQTISRYRLLRTLPAHALRRPRGDHDTTGPAAGVTLPLAFTASGKLLVQARINGKGPFPFVLDSGGHAILTPATAHALGLQTRGDGVSYGAGAGHRAVRYAHLHTIGLGAAQIDDQSVLVMGFSPVMTDRGDKPPVAGLLGLDVFERFAVSVDPGRKTLTLTPFKAFRPATGAVAVPICFTDDMPLVHATLDGRKGLFGIDTGNSGPLMLFPRWAGRNGLSDYYRAGVAIADGGVGGSFTAHMAYIRSLTVGGLSVPGNEPGLLTPPGVGATSNPSEAGNLGMSVWRAFRFTLDYRDERLYLTPRRHYTPPHPSASGGFRAVKLTPRAFTVIQVTPGGPAARVGLKKGDHIVAVDGVEAARLASLYVMAHIARSKPGAHLTLIRSDGRTVTVVLTSNAAQERAMRPTLH